MAHIDFWAENRTCFKMLIINVEKKSTKILAYHKPQVATFLCIDVENDGYCCFAKMLNFGSKTFKMLEFTFGIDLLLSHIRHFWFSKMHCQNLTRKKMLDELFMLPQNFGTKFKIYKKVLNIC